jgi:hypothetical protein
MRAFFAVLALVVAAACGPRQVDVTSGAPTTQSQLSLTVVNNETQPIQVYVVQGGNPMFIKQVGARSTDVLSVPGVASGSSVTLRATRADGSRTWNKDVNLTDAYRWEIP